MHFLMWPQGRCMMKQRKPGVKSFKPEHANQWEVGVKGNLISDKLFATLSVYDIRVANRVYETVTILYKVEKPEAKVLTWI